jgi:type I restriction enzyme M protein
LAKDKKSDTAANLGFEAKLWATADALHGNMDVAEYKQVEPYHGRVYHPCCGSSGMFVQSVEFVRAHASDNGKSGDGGKAQKGAKPDISIYSLKSNYTTCDRAKMNLAARGIDGHIGHGDTFQNERHPELKADFILATPPFNDTDWRGTPLPEDLL